MNRNDRNKPIIIGHPRCENFAMYFVFEDHDATILTAYPKRQYGKPTTIYK